MNKLTNKDIKIIKVKILKIILLLLAIMLFICDCIYRKNIIELILIIILIIIEIYFIINVIIFTIKNSFSMNNYTKYIEYILKNYDSNIVETEYIPEFDKYTIIKVNEIKELIDVTNVIKEPILYAYYKEKKSSLFYIKNNNDLYLYVVKENDFKEKE